MKVIIVCGLEIKVEYLDKYGTILEEIKGYDNKKYIGVDTNEDYDLVNQPVLELEKDIHIIKWFESDYTLYLTDEKLELFRNKIMKDCQLTESFSLEKMKELIETFIQNQLILNIYSLIEFTYEHIGVLLPEQTHSKEPIPTLYMMFEPFEIYDYEDDVCEKGKEISIKQHSLMMELPMSLLKIYYGLTTKISQVYRSLFPNTWSQAYFNFTSNIIIHPIEDDKMIVITMFSYYHGYMNHPNTHTLLDNVKTVQLLKDKSTTLSLVKDYTLNVPFPTIFGVSNEFNVIDENMDVKVACYCPEFTFGKSIELSPPDDWKIPGDSTFGYLNDKDAFDPHQYHYILRRLTRSFYGYRYQPYYCIMSEDDLPEEVMYFKV
jgi:hypothetical protein